MTKDTKFAQWLKEQGPMDPQQKLSEAIDVLVEALAECGIPNAMVLCEGGNVTVVAGTDEDAPLMQQLLGKGPHA